MEKLTEEDYTIAKLGDDLETQFNYILQVEGDRKEFTHNGIRCKILRHEEFKHLNGYVLVPEEHKNHGLDYNHENWHELSKIAHRGLTYSNDMFSENEWWVGFDTCHHCDFVPGFINSLHRWMPETATYKNMQFVEETLREMADWLRKDL